MSLLSRPFSTTGTIIFSGWTKQMQAFFDLPHRCQFPHKFSQLCVHRSFHWLWMNRDNHIGCSAPFFHLLIDHESIMKQCECRPFSTTDLGYGAQRSLRNPLHCGTHVFLVFLVFIDFTEHFGIFLIFLDLIFFNVIFRSAMSLFARAKAPVSYTHLTLPTICSV